MPMIPEVIATHSDVAECAVFASEDTLKGQLPMLSYPMIVLLIPLPATLTMGVILYLYLVCGMRRLAGIGMTETLRS